MDKIYDVIIIGGGPAGLTAGIYAGRAKLKTLIIEKATVGGQITVTNEVVNYPGIMQTTGTAYGEELKKQALSFGTEILSQEVVDMDFSEDIKVIKTRNQEYKGLSVIIATGASPRKLGFKGEKEFEGRGVAYCATCDGEFFTSMEVFVIGAGFAAAEEAIFLTKFAKKVTVIAREPEFTCAKSIADKVLSNPKIEVRFNTEILEATGDIQLRQAKFINNQTKEVFEYNVPDGEYFGIFIFVGYQPQSEIFRNKVDIDTGGFILADENLMTNVKGVFVAGDVRPKSLRQLVTATSDGAQAAFNIEKYVTHLKEKLGMESHQEEKHTTSVSHEQVKILDNSIVSQLKDIFERFENKVKLVLIKDNENKKSYEMESMLKEICDISNKIEYLSFNVGENKEIEKEIEATRFPTIAILNKDEKFSGIKYSTLPSGHELNSFILAIYNVAGPGQSIQPTTIENIKNINSRKKLQIGISLSCTKCPELVQAAQRIAVENQNIDVEVIDVFTFNDFKQKYNIMSVPALIINDGKIFFGAKNIDEILKLLNEN